MKGLTMYERELLHGYQKRYAKAATLMAGVVYEVDWGANDVWNCSQQVDEAGFVIAWLTDPLTVGSEPSRHRVVIGPSGITVTPDGKRHRSSGLPRTMTRVPNEPLSELRYNLDYLPYEGELSEPGWLLLRGPGLSRADLVFGRTGPAPGQDLAVLSNPQETVHGVLLGSLEAPEEWVSVELGKRALNAARKALPKPGGAPRLRLLADYAPAGLGTPAPVAEGPSYFPSPKDQRVLLEILEGASPDAFPVPIHYEYLADRGAGLELSVTIRGQQERIEIAPRTWDDRDDLLDDLVEALGAVVRRYREP